MKQKNWWALTAFIILQIQQEKSLSSAIYLHQGQQSSQTVSSNTESKADQAQASLYKSDALDELLEGSLFKKKKTALPVTEDTIVDLAMSAKVDPKDFNLQEQPKEEENSQPEQVQDVQTNSIKQSQQDALLIQKHLSQFEVGQKDMGSSILYGAINDLDITDSSAQQLAQSDQVSPWEIGKAQGAVPVDLEKIKQQLDDQSATQLSAEAAVRGSNKYEEQAEQLLNDEDNKQKNNQAFLQILAQQKQQKEEEEKDVEEMLGSAFTSLKSNSQVTNNIQQQIKLQNDLEYIVAFGGN